MRTLRTSCRSARHASGPRGRRFESCLPDHLTPCHLETFIAGGRGFFWPGSSPRWHRRWHLNVWTAGPRLRGPDPSGGPISRQRLEGASAASQQASVKGALHAGFHGRTEGAAIGHGDAVSLEPSREVSATTEPMAEMAPGRRSKQRRARPEAPPRTLTRPLGEAPEEDLRPRCPRLPRMQWPDADNRLHRPARGWRGGSSTTLGRLDRAAAVSRSGAAGGVRPQPGLLGA